MIPRTLLVPLLCGLTVVGCSSSSSSRSNGTTTAATTSSSTGGTTSAVTSSGTSATTTTPPPASWVPVDYALIQQGTSSPRGVNVGAHEVQVANDADWTTFWPTHSTALRPPTVDFTQETVIGTFMPQTPGNANATQVVNVWRDANSDDLRARVREFRQGVWITSTMRVQTTPFHLVRAETAVSGQGTLTIERQALLDFEVLAAGSNNALGVNNAAYAGGLEVFRDAAAFAAFYAQIQPGLRPPAVNFQTEMVVAVLGEHIPRFGNRVETLRVLHDPAQNAIRVRSRITPYRGGAAPPPAVEAPFQLLRVSPAAGTIRPEVEAPQLLNQSTGLSRNYTGPSETLVVRDSTEFVALWSARVGGVVPSVDFTQDQVLIHFEAPASNRNATVASAMLLEDDELAVTVNVNSFGTPTRDSRYSMAIVSRTYGPVGITERDITPRP